MPDYESKNCYICDGLRIMTSPQDTEIKHILRKATASQIDNEIARRNFDHSRYHQVSSTNDFIELFWPIRNEPVEVMAVSFLDNNFAQIQQIKITQNDPKQIYITARQIVKEAVHWGASAVAMAHNHPHTNSNIPSDEDIRLTCEVAEALFSIKIALIDHIIFSIEGISSFCDSGLLGIINASIAESSANKIANKIIANK